MKYVLAHQCNHEDHEGECREIAYLFEESTNGKTKIVKEFTSKNDAEQYIKINHWDSKDIMIIPKQEMEEI
tara:strand:+ start:350 stop:562 length:213 start_codon:yes stop_codon:yes gene_type:complete